MRLPDSYAAFAHVYDRGLGQIFFDGVRPVLDGLDREFPSVRRTHLELACGTGRVVRYFRAKGFDSIGLDALIDLGRQLCADGLRRRCGDGGAGA